MTALAHPTWTVSGYVVDVDDNNAPVADAKVTVISTAPAYNPVVTMTDANGFYRATYTPSSVDVQAEKAGYEPNRRSALIADKAVVNLGVHRILRIPAGASTTVAVTPDDATCGYEVEGFACRMVHVLAPHGGTMALELVSETGSASGAFLQVINHDVRYAQWSYPGRATMEVLAGEEITVQILFYPVPNSIRLNTSLQ